MLNKTLRVKDNTIILPGLEKYKGKWVEITVRESRRKTKNKLEKFFALCGQVQIDSAAVDKLREKSYI